MQLNKKSVARNYAFLAVMLGSMILGSVVGWIFPQELDAEGNVIRAGATVLEPLGTLFLNMMFCIVVPMVFSSIFRNFISIFRTSTLTSFSIFKEE